MFPASLPRLLYDLPANLIFAAIPGAASPTPVATAPSSAPVNPPPSLHDVADLALQVSIGIVTVVTLFIGAIAIFGVREAKDVRKLSKQLRTELKEVRRTKAALEDRLQGFEAEFETFVLAAHLFHEGETAYLAAEYDRAISFYEEALTIQPDNGKIHIRLARALTNKGFNSRAERSLRIALQRDEQNSDALRALATIKRYAHLDEAIELMEKALLCDDSSEDKEISNRYGHAVSEAVDLLSAPMRPGESRVDRRSRKETKARQVEAVGGVALTVHFSDILDNVVSWRNITSTMSAWKKLPRWLWQASNWYIPLAERHRPEVAVELRAEVEFERGRGISVGSWLDA